MAVHKNKNKNFDTDIGDSKLKPTERMSCILMNKLLMAHVHKVLYMVLSVCMYMYMYVNLYCMSVHIQYMYIVIYITVV